MILRCIVCLCLFGLSVPSYAAFNVDQLMQDLALNKGGRARFVEKRYMTLLDKPVVSTGEMRFTAPDRLERRTQTPKPEILQLEGDQLTIERDGRKMSIDLAQQPQAKVFVDSIRSTLSGNRGALEKDYLLRLSGTAEKWQLALEPRNEAIAELMLRITVRGRGNQIRHIEYLQADGDRVELSIEPISDP